jgi:hypothetical protein
LISVLLFVREIISNSRREITERGVPPLAVVEGLDVVEDGALGLTPAGQERRRMISFFRVAKNDSATARYRSKLPREPVDIARPASPACWPKASDTY